MKSLSLLRHHGPMIKASCQIVARAIFPSRTYAVPPIRAVTRIIAAPSRNLIEQYLNWCGAADKYPDTLPPHMVAQWGLPIAAQLLLQTPFNLTRIINQGITLHINGDLPRNTPLHCFGQIQSLVETKHRTRISVLLQTGTKEQPDLVEAVLHMVFIHSAPRKNKRATAAQPSLHWEPKGSWSAANHDGLRFALITGDFNPIHWLGLAGKLSALQNKILHGFGTFARTFEQLTEKPVRKIDLRFLRPVPLPSAPLQVEQSISHSNGEYQIRLRGPDEQMHLAGSVSYQ